MLSPIAIQARTCLGAIKDEKSRFKKHPLGVHSQEFVELSDEVLCRNAQRGCAASLNLLWHRHQDFIQRIVYNENCHQYLPQHEMSDVLQELYFAFHETVQRFDPENHGNGRPASFKTLLGLVVVHAFSKYCTRWRRYHQRIIRNLDDETSGSFAVEAEENWHSSLYPTDRSGCSSKDWKWILLSELSSDGLADALRRLKSKEVCLLELWLQYGCDKEVAQALGISPSAAKLRRERLFHRIREMIHFLVSKDINIVKNHVRTRA